MKTNQVMCRQMGKFSVYQRTKDGFFNATKLVKDWNNVESNPKRELKKFWESVKVQEFLEALAIEENYDRPEQAYVKSRAARGKNAGTWVNPYVFIKLAMWLNPRFEVQVIKFVYDQLIEYRHRASDSYCLLTSTMSKHFKNKVTRHQYAKIASGLNYIAFGRNEKGLRQTATEEQLRRLEDVENKFIFLIEMGVVKNTGELITALRRYWRNKNEPRF